MKTGLNPRAHARPRATEAGWLMADLMAAIAILTVAMLPLAYSFAKEFQLVRASYWRGLAMEIVDGEMEVLAAGEWRAQPDGTSAYAMRAPAATNLPPGRLELTKSGGHLRLEWTPESRQGVGAVVREVTIR